MQKKQESAHASRAGTQKQSTVQTQGGAQKQSGAGAQKSAQILPAQLVPYRKYLCSAALIVSFFLFLQVLDADMGPVVKFVAALIILAASGEFVRRSYSLDGGWGLIMLRSKKGLSLIDRIASENQTLLKWLADIGLVVSFGLLSYFMMSKEARKPRRLLALFILSFPILIFLAAAVAPSVFPILSSALNTIDFAQTGQKLRAEASGVSIFSLVLLASLFVGGFALLTALSLLGYSIVVLAAVANALLGNSAPLDNTSPGAAFILPGINLPFFEAIFALAIMLIVHEASHGLLARVGKIKLDSAGLVFFGFLPMGAFIDPDEKQLKKTDMHTQNRVLVAGSASNFATSIALFLMLILFMHATYDFRADAVRVEGVEEDPDGADALSRRVEADRSRRPEPKNGIPSTGEDRNAHGEALAMETDEETQPPDEGSVRWSIGDNRPTDAGVPFQNLRSPREAEDDDLRVRLAGANGAQEWRRTDHVSDLPKLDDEDLVLPRSTPKPCTQEEPRSTEER